MAAREQLGPDQTLGVLIVCSHRLESQGLRLALEQDERLRVVGLASDPAEAADLARRHAVNVVVVGWGWRDEECLGVIARVAALERAPPVLVISAETRPAHVRRAIEAGARGFVPADIEADELIHTLRTTAAAEEMTLHRTLVPSFLSHIARSAGPEKPRGPFHTLTPREQEVVRLLARGLMDRDIGQSLFISVRTVQTHLSHIYAKLGVHTRTEVALMALNEGWVPLPSSDQEVPEDQ